MVALCAGCNTYQPWAAILVGLLGGTAFMAVHLVMLKMTFDDPLDAVAVHGAGGKNTPTNFVSFNMVLIIQ